MRPSSYFSRLSGRWRALLAAAPATAMLVGGAALMLIGLLIRWVCGSPWAHPSIMASFDHLIPPVWLMSLVWLIWYAILGATLAALLATAPCRPPVEQAEIFRGCLFYLSMLFLGFFWYPLFFGAGQLLLAALLTVAVLCLCIGAAVTVSRPCPPAAVVLFCHAGFLVWAVVISFVIVFGT